MSKKSPAAYFSEFLGTMILVLFIALILAVNSKAGLGFTDFAVIGLVHAFALATLIATLAGVSGAHFNPAVTVALSALRKIGPLDAVIYVVCQIAGATVGALIARLLLTDQGDAVNYGATLVSKQFHNGNAFPGFVAEAIGTFVLMWAILGTVVNTKGPKELAPWIIGGTLGFAVMTLGPLTGAGFNPARSIGPAIVSGEFGSATTFISAYISGPLIGALLATLTAKFTILKEQS